MRSQSIMLTAKALSKFYTAYTLSLPIRQVKSVFNYELQQQLLVSYDERSPYISHSSQKLPMPVTIVLAIFATCFKFDFCRTILQESSNIIRELH